MPELSRVDVLIVGAGPAGVQVAHSLQRADYRGSVLVLSADSDLPYERPPLSKAYLRGEVEQDTFALAAVSLWESTNLRLELSTEVVALDIRRRAATLSDGREIEFGTLVWSAGGTPRPLAVPGYELRGVHHLYSIENARALVRQLSTAKSAVVIGGGHIGLEAAAAFRWYGLDVTVLEALDRLLARIASPDISDFYLRLHRDNGVDVQLSVSIDRIEGIEGRVTGVRLANNTTLPADLVLVGIGIIPNVEPMRAAGVVCSNGIDTDETGMTSVPGVYAAGDCANRFDPQRNVRVRLESVPNAIEQGKQVANAILGLSPKGSAAPWFWSHQYDVKLQTVGLSLDYDETVVRGDPGSGRFTVVYYRRGRMIALDCVGTVKDFVQGRTVIEAGVDLPRDAVASGRPFSELLAEHQANPPGTETST